MSKIFRSRWSALLWAAGILWTAYDVAEASAPTKTKPVATPMAQSSDAASVDASAVGISNADLAVLKNYVDGS